VPNGSIKGLKLVVNDIRRTHEELVARGVAVGDVQVLGENPGLAADPLDNVGLVLLEDSDENA
jgi:hypothetical protein